VALQQFAYLMIGNRDDARDAVQGALVGAFRT
jgi:DNA-directed RNA polymerase specialized sigma24 family protein